MRVLGGLSLALALGGSLFARASPDADAGDAGDQTTFQYQSDISRLRSIVIHSLYSQKDVFARELLSNSNDALEKLRLVSLKDRSIMEGLDAKGGWQGNITLEARKYEDKPGGQLILRDTGIGMTRSELATNLGTIAKSGTAEFLKKASGSDDSNLIGQFGLGFYSVFLVSSDVQVSSLPPPTLEAPNPRQHTFVSSATGDEFKIFPDPRGQTLLPCGTEIVLEIDEEGAKEGWLDEDKLKAIIEKHSQFATTFPIYLLEHAKTTPSSDADESAESENPAEPHWVQLNDKAPIWMRDIRSVPEEEYTAFYQALTKQPGAVPLGHSHFKGDSGSGVSYRGIMYLPHELPASFWERTASVVGNIRLLVKRVFITDDLGEDFLPRWLSFLKIIVDADDLPLNVSRETLQQTRFIRQLQRILFRKALDMFAKIAKDDPVTFQKVSKIYGNALRIGVIETSDKKDRNKLADLLRFESTLSNYTSLDEYVSHRRGNQKQIFYIAGVGETPKNLARSPFVEKLQARGYEVLLLNQPADEGMVTSIGTYKGMQVQDVSKRGLKYGDEEEDEAEAAEFEVSKKAFLPLLEWLKKQLAGRVSDVVLTNRLVTSPCTIITDYGFSANMARLMAANVKEDDPMYQMMMNAPKILEINPKSPLIIGLLERVMELPAEDENSEEAKDLGDIVQVLFDTTSVRSGFTVGDSNDYFDRVESLLRQSLGVSLTARGQASYKPAPPVATGPLPDEDEIGASDSGPFTGGEVPQDAKFADWKDLKAKLQDKGGADGMSEEDLEGLFGVDGAATTHDEL